MGVLIRLRFGQLCFDCGLFGRKIDVQNFEYCTAENNSRSNSAKPPRQASYRLPNE